MLEPSDLRDAVIALLRGLGAIIASAVALLCLMMWALSMSDQGLARVVVLTAGVTYFSYLAQILSAPRWFALALVISSNLLGILAFIFGVVTH